MGAGPRLPRPQVAPVPRSQLRIEWLAWVVTNLTNGASCEALVGVLVQRGVPPDVAAEVVLDEARTLELGGVRGGAIYEASAPETQPEVAEVRDLSQAEFRQEFYDQNRPVVIRGFADGSPVLKWSLKELRKRFAAEPVWVQAERDSSLPIDAFRRGKERRMRFDAFVDLIESGVGNRVYLTGNDGVLREDAFRSLCDDLRFSSPILEESRRSSCAHLWVGAAGAVSPLHRDRVNVLNVQVLGAKRFLLAHPLSTPYVYPVRELFCPVDVEAPDLKTFPRFASVRLIEATLEPSDALFIPVGWWHHVRALTTALNLSFTSFPGQVTPRRNTRA